MIQAVVVSVSVSMAREKKSTEQSSEQNLIHSYSICMSSNHQPLFLFKTKYSNHSYYYLSADIAMWVGQGTDIRVSKSSVFRPFNLLFVSANVLI